jgi:hypothetical protein
VFATAAEQQERQHKKPVPSIEETHTSILLHLNVTKLPAAAK